MRQLANCLVAAALLSLSCALAAAQPADVVFVNGRVVTVDDRFTVAQAMAVRGERVAAVGSNGEIDKLKGPATRTVDLGGRTVIPGLIDNHAHYMRAAENWHREVRLDGIASRQQALDLIAEKARQ